MQQYESSTLAPKHGMLSPPATKKPELRTSPGTGFLWHEAVAGGRVRKPGAEAVESRRLGGSRGFLGL